MCFILEITGNSKVGFLEEDLDGDFDPSKYDELMKVSCLDSLFQARRERGRFARASYLRGVPKTYDYIFN